MRAQRDATRRGVTASGGPRPELVWVGDGGWIACDPVAGIHDPRRVLAYLECRDSVVRLQWVRDSADVVEFSTLREALDAVDGAFIVGGVRQSPNRARGR
ncbi:hypothetical protein JNB63_04325 [Microbacterium trichothecenolyticum]|uniref:hypothetical protein n=1 Tax=Microbacterium trichothecenolyticum TaxID=69370 RepID=UPI001C6EF792|nr:hypothetical protein [Microbacterium trichothecenolyticum]MBW9119311.1 hypothetical protein [Microbacterium trichothecenolyticum]